MANFRSGAENVQNDLKPLVTTESKEVVKVMPRGFRNHPEELPTGQVLDEGRVSEHNSSRWKLLEQVRIHEREIILNYTKKTGPFEGCQGTKASF